MKQENKKTGNLGEDLAAEFLKKKGYKIMERNFSTRFGEIDIIANKNGVTVFVEVKTKKGGLFGLPEEMVSKSKLEKVRRMSEVYLKGTSVRCRIDMVAVVLGRDLEVKRMTHHENLY